MRSTRRATTTVAALVIVIASAITAASVSATPSKSLAGGTYTVGWEASFNLTDGFDPTGEYLGDAIGVQVNLLVRTLVGANHVAGALGNTTVPDLATSVPKPTNDGHDVHVHAEGRDQVRPAREPRGHLAGHRLRASSGSRTRRTAAQYRLLLRDRRA